MQKWGKWYIEITGVDGFRLDAVKHIKSLFMAEWIKEMNQYMNIPKYLDCIQKTDIPAMAKHAARESNPLYPVPKLMNSKELEMLYYIIGGKHLSVLQPKESDIIYADKKNS